MNGALAPLLSGGQSFRILDLTGNQLTEPLTTQGIDVAVGLQKSFDWAGVAAAGVGAGVGSYVGGQVHGLFGETTLGLGAERLVSGMAGNIANAATRSLINGSDFGDNIIAALPDTIGQTIGNMIAGSMQSSSDFDERWGAYDAKLHGDLLSQASGSLNLDDLPSINLDGSIGGNSALDIGGTLAKPAMGGGPGETVVVTARRGVVSDDPGILEVLENIAGINATGGSLKPPKDIYHVPKTIQLPSTLQKAISRIAANSYVNGGPLEDGLTITESKVTGFLSAQNEGGLNRTNGTFRPDLSVEDPNSYNVVGDVHSHPYDDRHLNLSFSVQDMQALANSNLNFAILQNPTGPEDGPNEYLLLKTQQTQRMYGDEDSNKAINNQINGLAINAMRNDSKLTLTAAYSQQVATYAQSHGMVLYAGSNGHLTLQTPGNH